MKKKMLSILMVSVLLCSVGCGGKTEVKNEKEEKGASGTAEISEEDSAPMTDNNHGEEALAGVYSVGDHLTELLLGTYYEGQQENFVSIQVPENYLIGAIYYLGDDKDGIFEMADGSDLVKDALGNGLLDQENKIQNVLFSAAVDASAEEVGFAVITSDRVPFDQYKEMAGQYKELSSGGYQAIYYVDSNEYATADLNMCYAVSEDVTLCISYQGSLAEELGLDQLAQNLYDLVEVIE